MLNTQTRTPPQDSKHINVNEDDELLVWSMNFGVTIEQVEAAIKEVGTSAGAVGMHLRSRPHSTEKHSIFFRATAECGQE